MAITKRFSVSDRDWRVLLLLIIPPLFLLLFLFLSISSTPSLSFFPSISVLSATQNDRSKNSAALQPRNVKDELTRSRIAVCLVGGARRFELTGPSIIDNVFNMYPNSDLFLHAPLDANAYKFSLLRNLSHIAYVKIFQPTRIPETESQLRVLTSANSPNAIQGLLQYFNLVEGCLTMIKAHQTRHNFTYDWIVRTRVDGYWNAPLDPSNFIPGKYLVPPGSSYGGLNDRLGIGNFNTSGIALSRLALIPELNSSGYQQLNSESAFKAQLITKGVPFKTKRLPFCIMSDRKYSYPPGNSGVPVAAMSSAGPLSGTKCRPCTPACEGDCVADVMMQLYKDWSWTEWRNGTLKLCDASGEWENGWEKIFDKVAGKKLAKERKRIQKLNMKRCINDFEIMKRQTINWETPPVEEICKLGLISD